MTNVFVCKVINEDDDRDAVKYVDIDRLGVFVCNHYFSSFGFHGACFSGGTFSNNDETENNFDITDFTTIKTILTEEDIQAIITFNEEIKKLKYGIEKGDERYNKGIALRLSIQPIIDKLLSPENEELFNEIIEEERDYLKDQYNFTDDDLEQIFDDSEYKDRAVVITVFNNKNDMGREEAFNLGYESNNNEAYLDYDKIADDLLDEYRYITLADNRIVLREI
jgi:hypothetical protein